jgi:thioredoxin-related protein
MANDLHGLGRESGLRKIPVVLFFSSVHCEYCDLVRDEFLNYLSTDPAFMNKLLLREVRMDSIRPLLDFSRQSISHAAFTEQRAIELVPTIQFTDGVGDILVEDIVGVTTLGFYGAYLEQAIEQSLNILRLRN